MLELSTWREARSELAEGTEGVLAIESFEGVAVALVKVGGGSNSSPKHGEELLSALPICVS